MNQPAERPAAVYRKRRVPRCCCAECVKVDPTRLDDLRRALTGKHLSELRQPRPRR